MRGVQQKRFWLVLLGAGLLGLGVNLRETMAFYAPWLVLAPFVFGWKFGRREVLYVWRRARFCVARVWMVCLLVHYRSDLCSGWHGWRESMREESARHPVVLANLRPYLLYYLISAPIVFLTVLFAPILEWRKHKLSPMLLLWLVAFCANALLFQLQHDC